MSDSTTAEVYEVVRRYRRRLGAVRAPPPAAIRSIGRPAATLVPSKMDLVGKGRLIIGVLGVDQRAFAEQAERLRSQGDHGRRAVEGSAERIAELVGLEPEGVQTGQLDWEARAADTGGGRREERRRPTGIR